MSRPDAVVVGGGAIGLASAWRLAQRGLEVVVCDPTPGRQATHASAGMLAPVTEVVLETAKELAVAVRSQNETARARALTAGLRTPDHFFGESGPDAYWSSARTLEHLRTLPPGVSEFMAHPGWCDNALSYSRYGRQRETEMIGLGTPAARAAVASLGITLCHFGDI